MKAIRKCKYCGKEFVAKSGMQKFCCEECQTKAKEARKKRQQDFMNAVEPVIGLQNQEYLTFAKAAILMGCSRQYVYKLVNEGKLAASRISSRMAFIRKADIEKMLAGNPYHRVLPTNRPKESTPQTTKKSKANAMTAQNNAQESEVLDYISGEEVMRIYKVRGGHENIQGQEVVALYFGQAEPSTSLPYSGNKLLQPQAHGHIVWQID